MPASKRIDVNDLYVLDNRPGCYRVMGFGEPNGGKIEVPSDRIGDTPPPGALCVQVDVGDTMVYDNRPGVWLVNGFEAHPEQGNNFRVVFQISQAQRKDV